MAFMTQHAASEFPFRRLLTEDRRRQVPVKFDEFESLAFDDDKARLDAFAIELQNQPDSQGYIIMYQGTDKLSMKSRNVE